MSKTIVPHRVWNLVRLVHEQGPQYIIWAASARLSKRFEPHGLMADPTIGFDQVLRAYRPTARPSVGSTASAGTLNRALRIAWVVPLSAPGSGGMADIVNLAAALSRLGHKNTLCFVSEQARPPDLAVVGPRFEQAYGRHNLDMVLLDRPLREATVLDSDVVIATTWPTAYIVDQWRGRHRRVFFVQDNESWFYPRGAEALLADNVYTMGFEYMTLGYWLKEDVAARSGRSAHAVDFSIDRTLFHPIQVSRSDRFRVAYYVRTSTPRRCYELGLLALRSFLEQVGADVEVLLFGDPYLHLPAQAGMTNLGALPRHQLAALYSSVDVVLSLSATNMSLIPYEAAACGAAVIELNLPPVRMHLTHGRDAYLAAPYPAAIADALLDLYRQPELCQAIAAGGQRAANALPDWDETAIAVARALGAVIPAPTMPNEDAGTIHGATTA